MTNHSGVLIEQYLKDNYNDYIKDGNTYNVDFPIRDEAKAAKKKIHEYVQDNDVKYYYRLFDSKYLE